MSLTLWDWACPAIAWTPKLDKSKDVAKRGSQVESALIHSQSLSYTRTTQPKTNDEIWQNVSKCGYPTRGLATFRLSAFLLCLANLCSTWFHKSIRLLNSRLWQLSILIGLRKNYRNTIQSKVCGAWNALGDRKIPVLSPKATSNLGKSSKVSSESEMV